MYLVLSILAVLSTAALALPFPSLSLLSLAALGPANASPHPDGSSTGAPKINLVYVLLDDWGWANWGVHNPKNPEIVTPNLDALLAEGIELDRHYVSGRNAIHVNVLNSPITQHNELADPVGGYQGMPINITTIPRKLKEAGYATHAIGKWNAGMATKFQTPEGRGYDTGLTYFDMDTDFFTEAKPSCGTSKAPLETVDMWDTNGPGLGYNGTPTCSQSAQAGCTYQDEVFVQRIEKIVANLSADKPFFLFWAPHAPHDPYQVPQSYLDKPIFASITQPERQYYAAMTNLLDDNVGRVITLLKSSGLWDNTLVVFSSDNGGPEGDGYGGNNFPLRGGKSSNWEGGVRVNGLVTGGAVPPSKRGTKAEGLIAIEDWYTTFCAIAGVSPEDPVSAAAGLPPPDGVNQWPYLSGQNDTSPREYVIMGSSDTTNDAGNAIVTGVLRSDGYKLLLGKLANNWWTGPVYPNSTTYPTGSHNCGDGCLFNVFNDPSEYSDIAADHPDIVAALTKVAKDQEATAYNPQRGTDDGEACKKAFSIHKGFWGP